MLHVCGRPVVLLPSSDPVSLDRALSSCQGPKSKVCIHKNAIKCKQVLSKHDFVEIPQVFNTFSVQLLIFNEFCCIFSDKLSPFRVKYQSGTIFALSLHLRLDPSL